MQLRSWYLAGTRAAWTIGSSRIAVGIRYSRGFLVVPSHTCGSSRVPLGDFICFYFIFYLSFIFWVCLSLPLPIIHTAELHCLGQRLAVTICWEPLMLQ